MHGEDFVENYERGCEEGLFGDVNSSFPDKRLYSFPDPEDNFNI